MRSSSFAFSFPVAFLSYVRSRASRPSSRRASRHAVSFRRFCCVVPSVGLSCLCVSPSRLVVSYGRRSVLLSACSRLVRRGVIALSLSCCLVGLGIPHLFIVPSLPVSSSRLGSSRSFRSHLSSRSVSSVGGSCLLMPGSRVRAVLFCSSLVLVRYPSRFMPPSWGRGRVVMAMGRRQVAHVVSSIPSSFSLATRPPIVGWLRGGMDMGRRSMLLAARPLPVHAAPFLPSHRVSHRSHLCPHPNHPKQKKRTRRKPGRRRRQIRTRRPPRDAPTRRNTRDEERDDSGKPDKTTR